MNFKEVFTDVGRIILLTAGVLSVAGCILSYAKISLPISVAIFSVFFCSMLHLLTRGQRYQRKRILIYIVLGVAAIYILYTYKNTLRLSTLFTLNHFIEVLKSPYNLQIETFDLSRYSDYDFSIIPFCLFLSAFLAFTFITLLKTNKGSILLLFFTSICCLFGLYFDVMPDAFSMTGVIAFWLSLFVYTKGYTNKTIVRAFFIWFIVLASSALIQYIQPRESYHHPDFMQYLPQKMMDFLSDAFSPPGASSLNNIRHGLNGRDKLGDIDNLHQTGRKIMQIQTSLLPLEKFYLRNYSGSIYQNNAWHDINENEYKKYHTLFAAYSPGAWYDQSAIIFAALKDDSHGRLQLANAMQDKCQDTSFFEPHIFKITAFFANESEYFFPYNTDISSPSFKYDQIARDNEENKLYSANIYKEPIYFNNLAAFFNNYNGPNKYIAYYVQAQAVYKDFVYTHYLQVPSGELDTFMVHFPIQKVHNEEERLAFINRLQQYFQQNYQYTLSPGKLPAGKDFISYFLNESHSGYCTYFASAAVLILRQAGIPARYVVGYAIPKNIITDGQTIGTDTYNRPIKDITVIDRYAHAWAEIYEDGWGWRPIDFTPGTISNSAASPAEKSTNTPPTTQSKPQEPPPEKQQIAEKPPESIESHSLLPLFIGLLLFTSISLGTWCIYCRYRLRRLFSKNAPINTVQLQNLYIYLQRLTAHLGLSRPAAMDYMAYARYLKTQEKHWQTLPIENLMQILLQIRFSKSTKLKQEQLSYCRELIRSMRHNLYIDLSPCQKLLFTYFYRL